MDLTSMKSGISRDGTEPELNPYSVTRGPQSPPTLGEMLCEVCGVSNAGLAFRVEYPIADRRLGYQYRQCERCRSLTLINPPMDLAPYYARDSYYSTRGVDMIDRVIGLMVAKVSFEGRGWWHRRLEAHSLDDPALLAIGQLGLPRTARILDVGCGSGRLLARLSLLGFSNLTGCDPFAVPATYGPVRVFRRELAQLPQLPPFDLIMFHHSLEHTPHPARELAAARQRIEPSGRLLVRLPVIGPAFETLGPRWSALDPPRHLVLPSLVGLQQLLQRTGFTTVEAYFDSKEWQFMPRGHNESLDLNCYRSRVTTLRSKLFNRRFQEFIRLAKVQNERGLGDCVAIFAKPS